MNAPVPAPPPPASPLFLPDLELRLVDHRARRYRTFAIANPAALFGGHVLLVAWGRTGNKLRTRTEEFTDAGALARRRRALVMTRRRHGYVAFGGPDMTAAVMHACKATPRPCATPGCSVPLRRPTVTLCAGCVAAAALATPDPSRLESARVFSGVGSESAESADHGKRFALTIVKRGAP